MNKSVLSFDLPILLDYNFPGKSREYFMFKQYLPSNEQRNRTPVPIISRIYRGS